jgi:hypothetical protein
MEDRVDYGIRWLSNENSYLHTRLKK